MPEPTTNQPKPFTHRERRYLKKLHERYYRLSSIIEEREATGRPTNHERSEREALEWALTELEARNLLTGN